MWSPPISLAATGTVLWAWRSHIISKTAGIQKECSVRGFCFGGGCGIRAAGGSSKGKRAVPEDRTGRGRRGNAVAAPRGSGAAPHLWAQCHIECVSVILRVRWAGAWAPSVDGPAPPRARSEAVPEGYGGCGRRRTRARAPNQAHLGVGGHDGQVHACTGELHSDEGPQRRRHVRNACSGPVQ